MTDTILTKQAAKAADTFSAEGLTTAEADRLQQQWGKNELNPQGGQSFFRKAVQIIMEPMFLLLLVAAVIYFILGEPRDASIMLIFVVAMIAIDIIQEWKTDKTLLALKDLSAPQITVYRDGREQEIASADLVPGDVMLITEGVKIPADGYVIRCNDLCTDESSLTGEAEGVWKQAHDSCGQQSDSYWRKDYCYAGTMVIQGSALIAVDKIAMATEYGKIGAAVSAAPEEPTPLQKQTGALVKTCAIIAAVLFLLVGVVTYLNVDGLLKQRVIESILSGITLSMAMIPEEFPVILTVFLSMGAWRLAKKNSLVRRLPAVETLGAVSVLCVDKTGTITENQMTVAEVWAADQQDLIRTMGLGCEKETYDPMEQAMLDYCQCQGFSREQLFAGELVFEYPFTNALKMMGHLWQNDAELILAAKGSPEQILALTDLSVTQRTETEAQATAMSRRGLRVIAVAKAYPQSAADLPSQLSQCRLQLVGLVGLADPPRAGVADQIALCRKAGIRVVMITGDNGITAASIAQKIGMDNSQRIITGEMLSQMSDQQLQAQVKETSIFSRVVPEHKMRIVRAFQENGEIVAMTGDGVNDAPALKYADIGIAMGKKGSEVSREAADLILLDDDFSTIVDTVRDGRRIYDNIRKAVGYVFTIHMPIALASLLAPMMSIPPEALLLLPLHVVLLELIIDPTCSIVLERQPAERDIMARPPRNPRQKMLTLGLLSKSVLQGLVIFAASFGMYYLTLAGDSGNAATARTMGLAVIMLANLFLVQVNSSDYDFACQCLRRLLKDKVMWSVNIGTIVGLLVIVYSPVASFLKLAPLSLGQLAQVVAVAAVAVLWYELVKAARKIHARQAHEN